MDDREADWQRMYRQENDARLAAEARAEHAERDAKWAEEKAVALLTKLSNLQARAEEAEGAWESTLAQRDEARGLLATESAERERCRDGWAVAARERDEARAEQRDAEASRDLLVAGYTRAIREWLATHPGDSVPDVVDLFGAVMAERDEARAALAAEREACAAMVDELVDTSDDLCPYRRLAAAIRAARGAK